MSSTVTVAVGSVAQVVARPNNMGYVGNAGSPLGTITWTTADGTKATVAAIDSPQGQAAAITGVGEGTVTITATSTTGQTSTVSVTVVAADDPQGFNILTAPPLVA